MKTSEADIVPYQLSEIPSAQSVLVFAPHPDDEVFGCGGAVVLHHQAGHRIHVVLLTAGDFNTTEGRDAAYANIRLQESDVAAKLLGVSKVECWAIADRSVAYGETLVGRVMAAIESLNADVVYAPSLWESHPDHRATAMAVVEAVRRLGGSRHLMLYELSAPSRPNRLLDISPVWEKKTQAMACFASQNTVLAYPEFVESLNRYRAMTLGASVRYVEAYEAYLASDLIQPMKMPFESEHRRLMVREIPAVAQDLPLVSVIVRTTARPSLAQALDSVLVQTYANIEVILVDAAGSGLTGFNIADWALSIRIASHGKPLPRAKAANVGLLAAKGQYCIFLDDDDWFYPDHIAKLVRAAIANPTVKAFHTGVRCVDAMGKPSGPVFDFPYALNELKYGNFMPIHGVLFARALVDLGCRFDEQFDLYEDWDFWLQIESHTGYVFVPGISAAYRVDSVSGAGVQVDETEAKAATAALFAKWKTCQTEAVFQELVARALARRHYVRLAQVEGERSQALSQEVQRVQQSLVASYEVQSNALQAANQARQDAHQLRVAHDQACSDRDFAKGESTALREEAQRSRAEALGWADLARQAQAQAMSAKNELQASHQTMAQLQQAQAKAALDLAQERQNFLQIQHVLVQANQHAHNLQAQISTNQAAMDDLQGQLAQARDAANMQHQALQAHQAAMQELTSSTSWQLTQPVRMVGKALRQFKRVVGAARKTDAWSKGPIYALVRGMKVLRQEGLQGIRQRLAPPPPPPPHYALAPVDGGSGTVSMPTDPRSYSAWVAEFDNFNAVQMASLQGVLKGLAIHPLISIVMPTYNTVPEFLERAIESVRNQLYPHWQLCICDDASPKPHVRSILQRYSALDKRIQLLFSEQNGHISKASNAAIGMATGDYIAFLDHDDELSIHALLRVVEALARHPNAKVLYTDEDKIDETGRRFDPYFKPDFNLGLLRSHNYMCHFAVYKADYLRELGGLRVGFEGAQDYDMALRAVDGTDAANIVHLPHLLYHWRAATGSTAAGHTEKSYAFSAGQRALTAHLDRRGLDGVVEEAPEAAGMYRVHWATPASKPLVSLVIPTRNGEQILRICLDSLKNTAYPAMEIIVVDNGSDEAATLQLLQERAAQGQIRVLRDDSPFNYSALNNRAVKEAAMGEFVLLLNNDIEVVTPEWLNEMLGAAMEPGVGCVGARLWYPNGTLQHGGVVLVCGVAGHAHKYLPKGRHGYMGRAVLAQDMIAVTAACLLVRKSIFLEVGGLDEGLAVAFNDIDFCLRVDKAGYRNHWTPYAELIHHESLTRGHEDTPEKQARFRKEIEKMQARWPALLKHDDPCYSPNLTAVSEDFSFAWPPRRDLP